jgi:hypothetical protein
MIWVTGPDEKKLEAISEFLTFNEVEHKALTVGMGIQDIYDSVLESDAVLMFFEGHHSTVIELATELGFALALGKPVYAIKSSHYSLDSRFLKMPGVRIFQKTDEAMDAIVEDFADEQQQTGIHGLGELDGLGTDPEGGGDPGAVP